MTREEFRIKVFSLSERIYPMAARMVGTAQAEDIIQEVMLKLWNKRKNLINHPNIRGFVILTARNHCIDLLRKKVNYTQVDSSNLTVSHARKEGDSIEWKELSQIVHEILKDLPALQKEVFEMRDLDGLETHEVAEVLGVNQDHVRVLLSRARKHLATVLEIRYNYERGSY